DTQGAKSIVTLVTTLGVAFLFLTIGEYLGILLKTKLTLKRIDAADNTLGSGLAVISVLVAVWLSASIVQSTQLAGLQDTIKGSRIVTLLDRHLPAAPTVIASIGKLIDPNGFPEVFSGSEPVPPANVPLPDLGDLEAAVRADAASVVKIQGQGCGGIVDGSGFVVGNGLVATNAHVVAGIHTPYIIDSNGTRTAAAIWFDPDLDLAVLRTSRLAGTPLVFNTTEASQGTAGAVIGYPGGGSFSAKPAAILDSFTATGRNIYGQGNVLRKVYELRADIIPGNSGGPVIAKDGSVIGVVFAESTSYKHVGYALTSGAVAQEITQARARNQQVSTGTCAE
ncbi:MAG TPA: MarP family serine protease, partial [Candidatus Microsaccharimonas sp.]|nr:MarP family serine protease [Candidatus Microsaccharimonas sp.]